MFVLKVVLVVVVCLCLLLLFLHSIKICDGGKIMQGCGKLLFPWSKKYKFEEFGTYCCPECFKRDYELLASKGEGSKRNLRFTVKEEFDGIEKDPDDGE